MRNIFKIKKTNQLFLTNYIDHHNKYVSIGDYRNKNNRLIKFNEIVKVKFNINTYKRLLTNE